MHGFDCITSSNLNILPTQAMVVGGWPIGAEFNLIIAEKEQSKVYFMYIATDHVYFLKCM